MASNFESWYGSDMLPWESRADARKRYEGMYGTTVQDDSDEQEEQDDWWERVNKRRARELEEEQYISDPDIGDQWSAGIDEAQASGASALAGPVSGFLSEYVSEDLGSGLKSWAEEQRDINLKEAAQVKRPETREEVLKRDPTSLYQYTPEFFPTGHEIVRSTPTSLAAAGIALPAAVVAAKAAGVVGLAAMGKVAVGAATGMAVGNTASSLQVAGESYERAKNDPAVRAELGVTPDKDFKDLSSEEQQKIDRFATDVSQSAFGHRLYTSGALEMASFIPYGGLLARWAADTGLGTASELWDRELYAEDAANTLVEYGMPRHKVQELQEKMLGLGPGMKETFVKSVVQEAVLGGGFSAFESITGASDSRVNIPATASQIQARLVEEQQKEAKKLIADEKKLLEKNRFDDELAQGRGYENAAAWQADIKKRENEAKEQKVQNEIFKLRAQQTQRAEQERESLIKARADELKADTPLTDKLVRLRIQLAKVKEMLAVPGRERSAEEMMEVEALKKAYGVDDETWVPYLMEQQIMGETFGKLPPTKEEAKQRRREEQAEVKEGEGVDLSSISSPWSANEARFARNLDPKGKASIVDKFKQILGWNAKADQEDTGPVRVSKRVLSTLFKGIEKKYSKLKDKFVVVDQGDVNAVADMLEGREFFDVKTGKKKTASRAENLTFAAQSLKDSRAWTFDGKIFLNADGISGKDTNQVIEQAVQLGMFHEPITHIGLKAHLGDKFNGFLDDFYKTNKRDIDNWVTRYASSYLDEGQNIKDITESKRRELAEEYLANNFVEFGVRDPNIIARIADSLTRGGFGLLGKRKVTVVQARQMLAQIQREYIGGERNIVTGDFFDRSHWLKPRPDTMAGEKEKEPEFRLPSPKVLALPEKTEGKLTPTIAESEVRHAKRVSTPAKRKLWQKTHPASTVPEITKRDKELTELAKKLEKGEITNEEYRTQYEEKFPIRTFKTVPKLSSKTEVAGAIKQNQYDEGKLIGEDSDLKDGMEILVRTDVDTVKKYDIAVVSVVSPEAKGSHYGRAIHIDSYKDGKPVKTVVRNLKNVLGIAAGENKFPMAYFKGTYRATSPAKVKALSQKVMKDPNWIQVGMEPKRQSSFYARETKTINGKKIEAGTPIDTAEEVYQVGMFAVVKNPTTKVAPTFTSREGKEVRFAKQPLKKLKSKEYTPSGISVSPMDFLDPKSFADPLELRKKMYKKSSVDPMSGIIRFSKKPERYKATKGDATWITWADEGNWIDFGKLNDLDAVKEAAEQDYLQFHFFTTLDPVERKNSDGPPKGVKELTSVDAYVERWLAPELLEQNEQLKALYRQFGGDKERIKKALIKEMTEKHVSDNLYNFDYLQQGYRNDPFFMSAVMRAMNYVQDGTNLGGPTRVDGAALAEVYEEFSDGKYTGLKRMYKDYISRAEQIEETRADKDKFTFKTTSGGKWIELPKITTANKYGEETNPKDIEKRDFIINRWHNLSRDNWCTTKGRERTYPYDGPMYVFRNRGESLIAIRFVGEQVAEIQSPKNNGTIPGEYLGEVQEFVDSPNITLSSGAQRTIDKAKIDAKKLAVIEERKEEGAKWEETPDGQLLLDFLMYSPLSAKEKSQRSTAEQIELFKEKFEWKHEHVGGRNSEIIKLKDDTIAWRGSATQRFDYFKGQKMLREDIIDVPESSLVGTTAKENEAFLDEFARHNPVSVIHGEVSVSGIPTIEETTEGPTDQPEYGDDGNIIDVGEYYWVKDITDILDNTNIKNMEFPELKNIYGKLEIGVPDRTDSGYTGTPYIHEHMISSAPKLISVDGQLTIGLNAHLPMLQNVGEDVLLAGLSWYDTKVGLKSIGGDLDVRAIGELPDLQTISGSLFERIVVYPQDHEVLANRDNLDTLREDPNQYTFNPSKSNLHYESEWKENTNNAFVDLRNLESVGSSVELGMNKDEDDVKHGHKIRFDSLHEIGRDLITGAGIYHRANPAFPQLYSVGMSVKSQADTSVRYESPNRIFQGQIENREPDREGAYLSGMIRPVKESDRDLLHDSGSYIDPDLWVKPSDAEKNQKVQSLSYLWETIGHRRKSWHGDIEHKEGVVKWVEGYDNTDLENRYTQAEIDEFRESSFLAALEATKEKSRIQPFFDKFKNSILKVNDEDIAAEVNNRESYVTTEGLKTLIDIEIERVFIEGKKHKQPLSLTRENRYLYRKNLEVAIDKLDFPWTTSLFPEEISARKDKIVEIQKRRGINAPNLTVVGRDVYVYSTTYMPNLKRVGGDIKIFLDHEGQFNKEFLSKLLPNIEKVGGRINVYIEPEKIELNLRSDQPSFSPETPVHKKFTWASWHHMPNTENKGRQEKANAMGNPFPKLTFQGHDHHHYDTAIQKEFKKKLLAVAKTLPDDTMARDWITDTKDKKLTFKEAIKIRSEQRQEKYGSGLRRDSDIFSLQFSRIKEIGKEKIKELEKDRNLLKAKARREQTALEGTVLDPRTKETTRFSKRIKQSSAKKLEAEWRKNYGKVKPDTEQPTDGININDSKQPFTEQILSGRKTIETRDTNSLKSFIGKRVGIIRTGKGKAEVVGYATVGEPVVYNNRAEFKKDQSKHLVKTGSDYDIKTGKTKYGYPLTNVTKVSPIPVTSKGIVSRKIDTPKRKVGQPSDKVSVGNKKFASGIYTRESISPKQFVNPKGEVRTSKILMRSAAAHAMGTSTWNPFKKWTEKTQPFADKLLKYAIAQGTLPDRLQYHAIRRVIKGTLKKAEDAGRSLYNVLKDTKQSDVIFQYFTTKGYDPLLITDRTERSAAVAAKAEIDRIGKELVDKGLMREATRQEYEGAYLPNVYLKYLLGEDNFKRAVTRGGVGIDMRYLKSRKDIPEGVKQLILGQVKDPAYLASKATSIPVKDMAVLDWLGHIAANPNWVVPKTMVSFDTIGIMKKTAIDNKVSKKLLDILDVKDTKAVKVSGYWLENEAARINDMINSMPELTADERKVIIGLTTKMKDAANEIAGQNYDTKLYKTVPKSPKYGMLAGIAVRKEIYDDVFGGMSMVTGDISTAEAILGNGSRVGDYNRLWKWAKVPANPPSWVRNFGSNLILMNLGGVSVGSMPGLMISSLADMRKAGKHRGKLHQLAKDLGLTAGTFSNVELGRIEREFKHLENKLGQKSSPWASLGAMKGAFAKFQDATTDFYGGIDSLGKMMMLKSQLDKQGITIKDLADYKGAERQALDDIAANAEKWLFDYSNVLPSVRYLRQAPFGAPFISFTSFVGPLMLETAITKPWKFAPYYALGWLMKEWFMKNHDLDEEDLEGLKVGLSEYLREKATESFFPTGVIPLPFLDENKRVQFLDVSYIYPWGMFSEIAGELSEGNIGGALKTVGLMGSPMFNIASAVSTGIDPFSRREIIDPNGTPTEQAMDIWWYAFNLTMPPMLHGSGPGNEGFGAFTRLQEAWSGELTKEGEARFTMGQAIGRMGGFNVTPLAVPEGRAKHLRYEYSQLLKLQRQAKRDITNMYIMQKPKDEIKERIGEYKEKLLKRLEKFKKKVEISKPPMTLIRERESFLREKKRSAQQYRASA